MTLANQVILITGASSGIGAALAQQLAAQYPGIRLVLTGQSVERLMAIARVCEQTATVLALPFDLSHTSEVGSLVQAAKEKFRRVDMLINNAGFGQMGPVELLPLETCKHQFEINFFAPLALIQAVVPLMRSQGGGRIINISSIAGRTAFPLGGIYSASKFALEAISDSLRMELEPFNIKVSVVEPGPVRTNFVAIAREKALQAIPQPEKSLYGVVFEQLESLEQRLAKTTWTDAQVSTVILRAMQAAHPHPRYVAAAGGALPVYLLTSVLPRRWVDRFWQKFYGIDLLKPKSQ